MSHQVVTHRPNNRKFLTICSYDLNIPESVAEGLRRRDLPIICRVREGALVFDPRTLEHDDADQIPPALAEVIRESTGT